MSKHTPGPWAVTDPDDGHQYLAITAKSGTDDAEDVATVGISDVHPNGEANANLIAAAPDLLEALVGALEELDRRDPYSATDPLIARRRAARAAIAKATP